MASAMQPPSPNTISAKIVNNGNSSMYFFCKSIYTNRNILFYYDAMIIFKKIQTATISILLAFMLIGCDNGLGIGSKLKVGDKAPKSNNLTIANPDKWYEISTMDTKVALYRWNIAELINEGKPFLAVFGTPQHCTMCVDQITRVAVMQEKLGDKFAFLHIDGYKDNSVWVEWGVKGEPWTFIVDSEGEIRTILPGQTELGLLEDEINKILNESTS